MAITLTLILALIAAAACLEVPAERLNVPRPIVLLSGGLVIALLPGLPRPALDPETIFVLFIPPLLYWAALSSSVRDFRSNAVVISVTGVALVLVTVGAVALATHALVPGVPWAAAVVLGAIVAPPDAVVTLSMLRGLSLPKRVTTILLGEGLVNDAASLVVYRIAVGAAVVGQFSWATGTLDFIWVAIGGVIVGLGVGWIVVAIRTHAGKTPVLQNLISLLTPFAAYVPADAAHVSGVIAVVVTGLYLGRKGPRLISAQTYLQGRDTWEVLTFVLESLTFLLIGFDLPYARAALDQYSFWTLVGYAVAISAVIALVRLVCAFPTAQLPRLLGRRGRRPAPPWRNVLFIGWAGLRGGDSLIVALTLPIAAASGAPFPNRNLIIVLTFGVVLIAILVQGLSLRPLVKILGLHSDGVEETEERDARRRVAEAGLMALESIETSSLGTAEASVVREVVLQLRQIHGVDAAGSSSQTQSVAPSGNLALARAYQEVRSKMVLAERAEATRLRDQDVISDEVMYRLLRVIDLEEVLLSLKMQTAPGRKSSRD